MPVKEVAMRGHTTHTLAEKLNLRRTGSPVSLALAALVVLFLAWLIFSTGGTAMAQTGGDYTLTRSVISGGGGELTGGSYTLAGTIGQPDAGALTRSNYTLGGGFWSGAGDRYYIYLPLVVRN
jgi:amino acid transporter